jgi:hypothetical protein
MCHEAAGTISLGIGKSMIMMHRANKTQRQDEHYKTHQSTQKP